MQRVRGAGAAVTLAVLDADKARHKIRLPGIACPEKKRAFGTKALEALSGLVFGKESEVEGTDKDRYGRLVGKVRVGTTDVNVKVVRDGYAWRDSQYDKKGEHTDAGAEAREQQQRRLWTDTDPVPPWEFRKKT